MSVINQDYGNKEYIIIDGGSTDGTIDIIKKYEKKIDYWISKKDNGQSDAINTGFKLAKGDILFWLNSDDTLNNGALTKVSEFFYNNENIEVIYGDANLIDMKGNFLYLERHLPFHFYICIFLGCGRNMPQMGTFIKRSAYKRAGNYVRNDFKFNMDGELWSRIITKNNVKYFKYTFANYRKHSLTKSYATKVHPESISRSKFELEFELKNSFKKLKISKILKFEYFKFLLYFFAIQRIFLRFIRGHYFSRDIIRYHLSKVLNIK